MAKKERPQKQGRIKQIAASYRMTRETDRRIGWILLGVFLVTGAAAAGLALLLPGHWALAVVTGVLFGLLAAMIVFGRRAQRAAFAQIEGQPGAAAAALGVLRRGWKVQPAIAFNKNQDIVHRVVGPPGIILVGEGNASRLKQLLANERRRHERTAADVPVHEVICGEGEEAVPVSKLARHCQKLGKNLRPADMTDVLARMKALDATRPNLPVPKGPMPTSAKSAMKGARQAMRGR